MMDEFRLVLFFSAKNQLEDPLSMYIGLFGAAMIRGITVGALAIR